MSLLKKLNKFYIKNLKFLIPLILCLFQNNLFSQSNDTFEFYNQDLKDIVYVLSLRSGKSIVCDDTVIGTGNFLYVVQEKSFDFDEVFDAFCKSNKLYVNKTQNLWTVSKIKIEESENNLININSYDSSIANVFEKISEKTGKSIIYEILPSQKISLHINNVSVFDAVKYILQPYSDYLVEETASGVQISKKQRDYIDKNYDTEEKLCYVNFSNGLFDVQLKNVMLSDVLEKLFLYTNNSYSNFVNSTEKIKYISFSQKDFDVSLQLVLEQINGEYIFSEDIYYLFQSNIKVSKESIISKDKKWCLISPLNCNSNKIIPLITTKYNGINVVEINNSNFAVYATDSEYADIKEYVLEIDSQFESEVIQLKYIKTSDLYQFLPATFSKDEIIDTGTGNSVFFVGNKAKRELFEKQLQEIDQPKKLVRYDLLILQYDKTSNLSWGASTSIRPTKIGDRTLVYGELGNLLNINFDAITAFGMTFSEKINTAIGNNEASVFADTTLYGLSGEKITFKNTNTYRYKDVSIDPQTGKEVYSTITREITSGLVLEIDGWVSGDNIITMEVKTSVSKQGVDTSSKSGNPPTTTEKNITTKIRAKNGEPVILSGLSQNDLSTAEQGVPGVSSIPVIGNLFKSKNITNAKSEMTIYLVPHIEENPSEESNECWEKLLIDLIQKRKVSEND